MLMKCYNEHLQKRQQIYVQPGIYIKHYTLIKNQL